MADDENTEVENDSEESAPEATDQDAEVEAKDEVESSDGVQTSSDLA